VVNALRGPGQCGKKPQAQGDSLTEDILKKSLGYEFLQLTERGRGALEELKKLRANNTIEGERHFRKAMKAVGSYFADLEGPCIRSILCPHLAEPKHFSATRGICKACRLVSCNKNFKERCERQGQIEAELQGITEAAQRSAEVAIKERLEKRGGTLTPKQKTRLRSDLVCGRGPLGGGAGPSALPTPVTPRSHLAVSRAPRPSARRKSELPFAHISSKLLPPEALTVKLACVRQLERAKGVSERQALGLRRPSARQINVVKKGGDDATAELIRRLTCRKAPTDAGGTVAGPASGGGTPTKEALKVMHCLAVAIEAGVLQGKKQLLETWSRIVANLMVKGPTGRRYTPSMRQAAVGLSIEGGPSSLRFLSFTDVQPHTSSVLDRWRASNRIPFTYGVQGNEKLGYTIGRVLALLPEAKRPSAAKPLLVAIAQDDTALKQRLEVRHVVIPSSEEGEEGQVRDVLEFWGFSGGPIVVPAEKVATSQGAVQVLMNLVARHRKATEARAHVLSVSLTRDGLPSSWSMPVALEAVAKDVDKAQLIKTSDLIDSQLRVKHVVPLVHCGDSDPIYLAACLDYHRRQQGVPVPLEARHIDHPLLADVLVPPMPSGDYQLKMLDWFHLLNNCRMALLRGNRQIDILGMSISSQELHAFATDQKRKLPLLAADLDVKDKQRYDGALRLASLDPKTHAPFPAERRASESLLHVMTTHLSGQKGHRYYGLLLYLEMLHDFGRLFAKEVHSPLEEVELAGRVVAFWKLARVATDMDDDRQASKNLPSWQLMRGMMLVCQLAIHAQLIMADKYSLAVPLGLRAMSSLGCEHLFAEERAVKGGGVDMTSLEFLQRTRLLSARWTLEAQSGQKPQDLTGGGGRPTGESGSGRSGGPVPARGAPRATPRPSASTSAALTQATVTGALDRAFEHVKRKFQEAEKLAFGKVSRLSGMLEELGDLTDLDFFSSVNLSKQQGWEPKKKRIKTTKGNDKERESSEARSQQRQTEAEEQDEEQDEAEDEADAEMTLERYRLALEIILQQTHNDEASEEEDNEEEEEETQTRDARAGGVPKWLQGPLWDLRNILRRLNSIKGKGSRDRERR
jgi:hypothetical protein